MAPEEISKRQLKGLRTFGVTVLIPFLATFSGVWLASHQNDERARIAVNERFDASIEVAILDCIEALGAVEPTAYGDPEKYLEFEYAPPLPDIAMSILGADTEFADLLHEGVMAKLIRLNYELTGSYPTVVESSRRLASLRRLLSREPESDRNSQFEQDVKVSETNYEKVLDSYKLRLSKFCAVLKLDYCYGVDSNAEVMMTAKLRSLDEDRDWVSAFTRDANCRD